MARFLLLLALASFASVAEAGLFRAYLSATGSDANPCTVAAPCRLLPAALAAIDPGGEVWMLDSANYNTGPVSVAKDATILAVPGALGSLVASGGPALTITAVATLRNLNIRPLPDSIGFTGVVVQGANGAASLDGCEISGFEHPLGTGLQVAGPAQVDVNRSTFMRNTLGSEATSGARVRIADSRMILLGANQSAGVQVSVSRPGASTRATIERTSIVRAQTAVKVLVTGGSVNDARVVVSDSWFEGGAIGVELNAALGGAGSAATLEMSRTTLVGMSIGVSLTEGKSSAVLSENTILGTSNSGVVTLFGGSVFTRQNNMTWPSGNNAAPAALAGF